MHKQSKGKGGTNWIPSKYRTFEKETHRWKTVFANLISDKRVTGGFYRELRELIKAAGVWDRGGAAELSHSVSSYKVSPLLARRIG